jgi:hypothetical protein
MRSATRKAAGRAAGMVRLLVHNRYLVECFDKDGNLKWSEVIENTVVTEGLADLLTKYFKGSAYTAAWYMGLKGSGAIVAGDNLTTHAGWSEVTAYTGNRPAVTFGTATGGSLPASAAVSFAMNGTYTVAGAFLCTVASGAGGTLYGGGDFATPRSGASGDTLNVTPTCTAASS